jgi:hypothetical protein
MVNSIESIRRSRIWPTPGSILDRSEKNSRLEMSEKPRDPDSWKYFIGFQIFIITFMTPVICIISREFARPGQVPGYGLTIFNALLAMMTGLGAGLVHRWITKRNTSLGFFYIPASALTLGSMPAGISFMKLLVFWATLFVFFALFVALNDLFFLWWERRKKRKKLENKKLRIARDPFLDDSL